jgi:hypothetical protein
MPPPSPPAATFHGTTYAEAGQRNLSRELPPPRHIWVSGAASEVRRDREMSPRPGGSGEPRLDFGCLGAGTGPPAAPCRGRRPSWQQARRRRPSWPPPRRGRRPSRSGPVSLSCTSSTTSGCFRRPSPARLPSLLLLPRLLPNPKLGLLCRRRPTGDSAESSAARRETRSGTGRRRKRRDYDGRV